MKKRTQNNRQTSALNELRFVLDHRLQYEHINKLIMTAKRAHFDTFFLTACRAPRQGALCQAGTLPFYGKQSRCWKTHNKESTTPLHLTVSISQKGYHLSTRGGWLPKGCSLQPKALQKGQKKIPTIGLQKGEYNHQSLRQCLGRIRKFFPKVQHLTVKTQRSISFQTLLQTMGSLALTERGKPFYQTLALSQSES